MKATDLQINDWVEHSGLNQKVKEISGLDNEVYLTIDECVDCTDVNSIPLTVEIMEKNFPTAGELAWWPVEDGLHCESRNTDDIMVSGVFRFVHNLQHALRLCGIEKEIKLK